MCFEVRCKLHWECGLQLADHVEVAKFFCNRRADRGLQRRLEGKSKLDRGRTWW